MIMMTMMMIARVHWLKVVEIQFAIVPEGGLKGKERWLQKFHCNDAGRILV